MFTPDRFTGLVLSAVLACSAPAAAQQLMAPQTPPQLGETIDGTALAAWDLHVFPDGRGLPDGKGTAQDGAALFALHCAACHGDGGRGATAEELVGPPTPPTASNPAKTIGAYWPHATTLFDYIRRSMPPLAPQSLSNDELYAIVAYLLAANGVITTDATLSRETLPAIVMPNRDGFLRIDVP